MTTNNNELDLQGLNELFRDENEIDHEMEQKKLDFKTEIDYTDALGTLKNNIYNANQILLKIQDEMNNGNFSARLVEVAGNLINSITAASKEILADENYEDYMEVRRALTQLKAKEVEIKKLKYSKPPSQTNVLVASREDVLRILDGKKPKQIEGD